jgi:threonine/homoserine/homoserine lactone efflux protein
VNFIEFVATIVLVSLSGVIAPGPLFAITIAEGKTNKYAGLTISTGHAIIEIPIIISLFALGTTTLNTFLKSLIGLVGGFFLLFFAYLELKRPRNENNNKKLVKGSLSGALMTALNPFFIIWWLTTGFKLVLIATAFGLIGLATFIVVHELCDFSWLGFVAYTSNKTINVWGVRTQKIITTISVSIMVVFGLYFVYDGILGLSKVLAS